MKSRSHFVGVAVVLLVIGFASLHPCVAATPQPRTEAEIYVLQKLQRGELADLEVDSFPENKREVSASFLAALLTNRDAKLKIPFPGISIAGAVIKEPLELTRQEIPVDVLLLGCIFEKHVDFTDTHFAKNLNLTRSIFKDTLNLNGVKVDFDFAAAGSEFLAHQALFSGMRVGRSFIVIGAKFHTDYASFEGLQIGGSFEGGVTEFRANQIDFSDMRVERSFRTEDCIFDGGTLTYKGSRFNDVYLNGSRYHLNTIDFTGMQAEWISFEYVDFQGNPEVKVSQMQFKLLRPVSGAQIEFLLSSYNAEFYSTLERSLRTNGYVEEADNIFVAKRRAERRNNCKDVLRQCSYGRWVYNLFQDLLAGYGKRLQNLLYWSICFLVVGTIVFRSENGMRTKEEKDMPLHAGKYHPFWYSLDLFLPIIKLGEADVWTPKDDRRWAHLYRKVHIIIGSLFVPIGLAAWTGIIK